ncbi:MAG: hypothetical protein A4E58_03328 [Syntrophorhabdus sp. PtaB.Bin006]|nr:MAG: hypothetical protein A4E58_03328 [Syntrophorhabdus sp. PtaB.Bin006]
MFSTIGIEDAEAVLGAAHPLCIYPPTVGQLVSRPKLRMTLWHERGWDDARLGQDKSVLEVPAVICPEEIELCRGKYRYGDSLRRLA